ncbi:MAG: hypothetical protein HY769_01490 [Candidatus Stahlbacteria bacterium]|nr:hypothetical protein [Candidatus Stahlbacteria bacterium]
MSGYIPDGDLEFDEWFDNFTAYVSANYVALGLTLAEKNQLVALNTKWNTDYGACIAAKDTLRGRVEMKNNTSEEVEEFVRPLVKRMTGYGGTTDMDRERMRINIPDKEPTPLSEDVVLTTSPALVVVDYSQPRIGIIHFGPNPQNENENAKPRGIYGVRIWYRIRE